MSLLVTSSLSRPDNSPTVGEEGEDEEDDEEWLSCFKGVLEVDEDPEEETGQAWDHDGEQSSRCCRQSESRL